MPMLCLCKAFAKPVFERPKLFFQLRATVNASRLQVRRNTRSHRLDTLDISIWACVCQLCFCHWAFGGIDCLLFSLLFFVAFLVMFVLSLSFVFFVVMILSSLCHLQFSDIHCFVVCFAMLCAVFSVFLSCI